MHLSLSLTLDTSYSQLNVCVMFSIEHLVTAWLQTTPGVPTWLSLKTALEIIGQEELAARIMREKGTNCLGSVKAMIMLLPCRITMDIFQLPLSSIKPIILYIYIHCKKWIVVLTKINVISVSPKPVLSLGTISFQGK